ncbi:hypothetical protein FLONG3_1740 [Fusarium longipes]|uniref:Uncharacterized protein n=1 Tax=Fusarium longipes TaxID=694270 RepID=A0A395T6X0_9HYPO|nr:hypothetical protein FLONG3_1740 [Fusarium longipes]
MANNVSHQNRRSSAGANNAPEEYSNIDENTNQLVRNQNLNNNVASDSARSPLQPKRCDTGAYDIPQDYNDLNEASSLPALGELSSRPTHDRSRRQSNLAGHDNTAEEPESPSRETEEHKTSKLLTGLYTHSYLVLFAILGTLARLGLTALTRYSGTPVIFNTIWANFTGSLVMGFLAEDRKLFRNEWGTPTYEDAIKRATQKRSEGEDGSGSSQPKEIDLGAAKRAHLATKKTIPLYIGLATGFCGSFTTFSSFIKDVFLALSNELATPGWSESPTSRNGGYSFMAMLAVIISTVSLSLSGLFVGAHLAVGLERVTPSIPFSLSRRVLDPLGVLLGWGCWLGAVLLAIFPPHDAWRGQAIFALVFAPLGCLLRFYLSLHLNGKMASFPIGTFSANVLGTMVLGMAWDLAHVPLGGIIGCQVLQGIEDGFSYEGEVQELGATAWIPRALTTRAHSRLYIETVIILRDDMEGSSTPEVPLTRNEERKLRSKIRKHIYYTMKKAAAKFGAILPAPPSTLDWVQDWNALKTPLNPRNGDAETQSVDARYEPQATDDALWETNSEKLPTSRKKVFYRPTALRWYFILGQIAFLLAVMGLVIWALIEMPNSDGTAKIIHKRNPIDNPNFPQGDNSNDSPMTPMIGKTRLATTVIVSDFSTVVTVPGTTGKYTEMITTTDYTTRWGYTTTVKDGSTFTSVDVTVIPTKVVTEVVTTRPAEVSESIITSISVGYSYIYPSGSDSAAPGTLTYSRPITITQAYSLPGVVATYTSTLDADRTETIWTTIVEDGETKTVSHLITEAAPTAYESVGETTASASTYVSYGRITITSVYTDTNQKPIPNPKPTEKAKPTVIDIVTVDPDRTIKQVEKLDPTTYVTKVKDIETVNVVISDAVETFVSEFEAVETTVDVVETGADGLLTTNKVVSTRPASLATITRSAAPTTIVSTKSTEKLKTITSDRTDSSTWISTVKGATRTYEKTTTIAPTATDDASEAGETGGVVKTVITVFELDAAKYFLGKFLPPMLAVMLSIPARVIDYNAQLFQPFYAMNQDYGARGPESMNLHFGGLGSIIEPFNVLLEGHPVPFITMLIAWVSALLAPIAVEAIGFKMHGQCKINAFEGCAPALGVSPLSSRILLALLGLIILLLCALLFSLRDFHTGLYSNPWSVAGIASLAANRDIRPRQDSERRIEEEMAEKRYGFGFFENHAGRTEYGIVLYDDAGENLQHDQLSSEPGSVDTDNVSTGRRNPFVLLGLAWRLAFLIFLLGLMVFLLYYHLTLDKSSSFKNFMNSQTFGVRFLFATFGVIISFSWTAFFITIAMVVPYQVMSHGPQSASNSVLLTRPTNPFSGFWSAIKHRQIFPGLVALMAIFSEFMPILLANIPYSLSQVRISHDICARISVGILALMALTIIISFLIRWPDMPVDPRSIAGAMYYVSESNMVDHFSGMAAMDGDERKQRIKELGGTYVYGELTTRSGERRPAVEWDDHTLGLNRVVQQQRKSNIHVRHESTDTGYYGHQS